MKAFNPYIIIFTLLLETLFLGLMDLFISTSNDIANIRAFVPFANASMLVITCFVILSLNQALKNIRQEMETRLLRSHLNQMDDIVKALHTHHQEYTNHMQTLQAMIYLGDLQQTRAYMDHIVHSYSPVAEMLNTGHTAITSLLYGKQKVAETKGVHFDLAVKHSLESIKIPAADLCAMFGNLLDNALEASMQSDSIRRVALEIKYENDCFRIYFINNGPLIPDHELDLIFTAGFSTAGSPGRGFGLYQARQLAESYGGRIEVINKPKTTFILTLPQGGSPNAAKDSVSSGLPDWAAAASK